MKVKINGDYYYFFDEVLVNEKLDSVASLFSFKGRFNPNNAAHKAIFRPLSYNNVEIYNDSDKLLLTGVLLNTSLGSDSVRELQSLSGYSKAGVLEDSTIPYSLYPLERNNVSLNDIVKGILPEFGLSFVVDSSVKNDMSLQYQKTVAEPTESIKSFLSKLAAQRNIVMSHDSQGNLLFFKPNTDAKPKAFFNKENALTMSMDINGQALHSEITVIRQPSDDNPGLTPVDTLKNSLVKVRRTIVKTLSSGTETDTKKAVDNILASELGNISFEITSQRKHENIFCGDIIEVQNDEIYLYERTKLMVSEITRKQTNSEDETIINCVLPESFTGKQPKIIF